MTERTKKQTAARFCKFNSKKTKIFSILCGFVILNLAIWNYLAQTHFDHVAKAESYISTNIFDNSSQEEHFNQAYPVQTSCTKPGDQSPFQFYPDPKLVPFKKRAVVLLLTSDNTTSRHEDMYYLNAQAMVYSLKHDPETRLNEDTEVAIMITETISHVKRISLLGLGVRLILVKSIQIHGISDLNDQWKNCYTKLYLFQMTFYQQILYMDTDLTVLSNPTGIFQEMDDHKASKNEYYFGAVQDLKLGKNTFNAGIFLFEPSCTYYDDLVSSVGEVKSYDSQFHEQGLLNWFFKKDGTGPSSVGWKNLPEKYNFQWINERPPAHSLASTFMHCKVWKELIPQQVYSKWRQKMIQLQEYQNTRMGDSDIFSIPENQAEFLSQVSSKMFGILAPPQITPQKSIEVPSTAPKVTENSKIVIYSLLVGDKAMVDYDIPRIAKNRDHYADRWNITHFLQRNLSEAVQEPVWQKLSDAIMLFEDKAVDWIWELDGDAFIMNGDTSVAALLEKYQTESAGKADIIIAKDCHGINAGSFFLRNSEWTNGFLKEWLAYQNRTDYPNHDVWKEQAALTELHSLNFMNAKDHIFFVPQKDINAYSFMYCGYWYQPNDFVVHSPGLSFYDGVFQYLKMRNLQEF